MADPNNKVKIPASMVLGRDRLTTLDEWQEMSGNTDAINDRIKRAKAAQAKADAPKKAGVRKPQAAPQPQPAPPTQPKRQRPLPPPQTPEQEEFNKETRESVNQLQDAIDELKKETMTGGQQKTLDLKKIIARSGKSKNAFGEHMKDVLSTVADNYEQLNNTKEGARDIAKTLEYLNIELQELQKATGQDVKSDLEMIEKFKEKLEHKESRIKRMGQGLKDFSRKYVDPMTVATMFLSNSPLMMLGARVIYNKMQDAGDRNVEGRVKLGGANLGLYKKMRGIAAGEDITSDDKDYGKLDYHGKRSGSPSFTEPQRGMSSDPEVVRKLTEIEANTAEIKDWVGGFIEGLGEGMGGGSVVGDPSLSDSVPELVRETNLVSYEILDYAIKSYNVQTEQLTGIQDLLLLQDRIFKQSLLDKDREMIPETQGDSRARLLGTQLQGPDGSVRGSRNGSGSDPSKGFNWKEVLGISGASALFAKYLPRIKSILPNISSVFRTLGRETPKVLGAAGSFLSKIGRGILPALKGLRGLGGLLKIGGAAGGIGVAAQIGEFAMATDEEKAALGDEYMNDYIMERTMGAGMYGGGFQDESTNFRDLYKKSKPDPQKPSSGTGGGKPSTMNSPASGEVTDALDEAADRVGVSRSLLYAMGQQESGFDPKAKAPTSSASGLFQFIDGTWAEMVKKYGKEYPELGRGPMDAKASAIAGALYVKENSDILAKNGIPVNGTSIYASHFLGPGGANKLFSANDDASAASVLPAAAKSNPNIFFEGGRAKTVAQVKQTLYNKVGKVAEQYETAFGERPDLSPQVIPYKNASNQTPANSVARSSSGQKRLNDATNTLVAKGGISMASGAGMPSGTQDVNVVGGTNIGGSTTTNNIINTIASTDSTLTRIRNTFPVPG